MAIMSDASPAYDRSRIQRDPTQRERYLAEALVEIPRLLGAIDRNPFRPTYGSLDRQYWHYRTSSFPSEMYQEGVLPLALVYTTRLPRNPWYQHPRVKELVTAAIRFAARASHADGSCDDYYPFERALGAAVFSLQACTRAYELLDLDDAELTGWFRRRADWLTAHDESGHLANHHALAALGLLRVAEITGDDQYRQAADERINRLLGWQSREGWFEEYGGADPGYQTVTIDCLAQYRRLTSTTRLDEPLRRAVAFARLFLHPDGSYGGEYGSRGTYHFYPHGLELLAGDDPAAADLVDGYLRSLASGRQAHFRDDRMYAHRLGSLLEAYLDWSPTRPTPQNTLPSPTAVYLPGAQLLVRQTAEKHTVVSAARGGVFKHFSGDQEPVTDAGLILETADGRIAVSQSHDLTRLVEVADSNHGLTVAGSLHWCRFETATPPKQTVFHLGMWMVGRWCRTLVRRLLQRRLITGRRECPVRLTRRFELLAPGTSDHISLRVTDTIELIAPTVQVRRMAFGTDHQAAYVAACGVYQPAVLRPWTDLAEYVEKLNTQRSVVVVREFA